MITNFISSLMLIFTVMQQAKENTEIKLMFFLLGSEPQRALFLLHFSLAFLFKLPLCGNRIYWAHTTMWSYLSNLSFFWQQGLLLSCAKTELPPSKYWGWS